MSFMMAHVLLDTLSNVGIFLNIIDYHTRIAIGGTSRHIKEQMVDFGLISLLLCLWIT